MVINNSKLSKVCALCAAGAMSAAVAAAAPCSDCGERTPAATADKPAAESRPADEPGTLRMHAPMARFFRTNGDVRRFKATVGFDPAIYTLKRKWGPTHVRRRWGSRSTPTASS